MINGDKSLPTLNGVERCLGAWLSDPETSKNELELVERSRNVVEFPICIDLRSGQSALTHLFVREVFLHVYNNARKKD